MATATFLLRPTDISLRIFSLVQLYTAIYLGGDIFDTDPADQSFDGVSIDVMRSVVKQWFQSPSIGLATDSAKVHYYSAIPLAIAAKCDRTPDQIGHWLCQMLVSNMRQMPSIAGNPYAVSLPVELRITERGYLTWTFGPAAIGQWLWHAARSGQWLCLPALAPSPQFQQSAALWQAQYVYARSGQYLSDNGPLDGSEISEFNPLEHAVLLELMQLIDQLNDLFLPLAPDFLVQAVTALTQMFERLERSIIQPGIEQISHIRLGLVMLIRRLLYQLVQVVFGLKLPEIF